MSVALEEPVCSRLRRDVEYLLTPDDPDIALDKRFFPRSKLAALLQSKNVQEVLDCRCARCRQHIATLESTVSPKGFKTIVASGEASAIILFALLTYIECPQFIASFLEKNCNDYTLRNHVDSFTCDYVRRTFWPRYDENFPEDSRNLGNRFWSRIFQFALPVINDGPFTIYHKSTIFPFLGETPLGKIQEDGSVRQEGAFGRVFAFEILDEYRDFPSAPNVRLFARKELQGTLAERFKDEQHNLKLIKKLKDPHLVTILKAYKHGEAYNLIFPCAMTNLGLYLRERRYQASESIHDRLECSHLWKQMVGITRALHRIITYDVPGATGENAFYGYHFDLKPANILVEDSGKFLITDFGHAAFRSVSRYTSKISGMGGSEAYAPPEIDDPTMKLNRRYDIWSLGCIFVEVCTFLVKGYDGMREFDNLRITTSDNGRRVDDRFFQKLGGSHYELKPTILHWIDHLPELIRYQKTREFLREILALTKQMLCVDVERRLTSDQVCQKLSRILNHYEPYPTNQLLQNSGLQPLQDEVYLGQRALLNIESIEYYVRGYWAEGRIRFVEDPSQHLTAFTYDSGGTARSPIGLRTETKLVPQYAFRDEQRRNLSDCDLYFSRSSADPEKNSLTKMRFKKAQDTVLVQSVLLGQDIQLSLELRDAAYEVKVTLAAKILGALPKRKPKPRTIRAESAVTVQLWSERTYKDTSGWKSRRDSPPSLRDFIFSGPGPRRIVLYIKSSILIVRLAKNSRIEKQNGKKAQNSVRIVPTDKRADSSFLASLLRAPSQERFPGFPLGRTDLDSDEERGILECQSLELMFRSEEDSIQFQRSYRHLKQEWYKEDRMANRWRKKMGETLGYAPV